MRSLSARLLLSITALLLIFFTLTALVLDRVFRDAAEEASAARLEIQRNSLLTAIEFDEDNQFIEPQLSEPRFSNPGSGLVAFIGQTQRDESDLLSNNLLWKSSSAVGVSDPMLPILAVGNMDLRQTDYLGERYIQATRSVEFELPVSSIPHTTIQLFRGADCGTAIFNRTATQKDS